MKYEVEKTDEGYSYSEGSGEHKLVIPYTEYLVEGNTTTLILNGVVVGILTGNRSIYFGNAIYRKLNGQ